MSSRTRSSGTGSVRRRRIARIVVMTSTNDSAVRAGIGGLKLKGDISRSFQPDQRGMVDVLEVRCVDEPEFSHQPIEQDRVGGRSAREEMDASQDVAVGNPRRDETDVVSAREILGPINPLLV